MRWIVVYLATAAVLLPIDLAYLGTVGGKLLDRNVADMIAPSPRIPAVALFYVVYLFGVVALVNGERPADWRRNALRGAIFGLAAYSTFELSNMGLLKHWEWTVVFVDIVWGTVMTGISAATGGLLASRLATVLTGSR